MSDGRGGDSDLTYSVVSEVTGFRNAQDDFDKSTTNPAYGYTFSNKTAGKIGNLEGSHPSEQLSVESKVDRKKTNALPVKYGVVSATYIIFLVVAVVLLIAAGVAIIIALVEISKLRAEVQALENSVDVRLSDIEIQVNSSELNDEINFKNISNSISIQQSVISQLSSELDNNSGIISNLATILDEEHIFSSCAAIQQFFLFQPSSGYYIIRSSNGSIITAYCDMTRSCGGITGGWMRVAELDMTDSTTQCPDSLELWTTSLRTCRIRNSGTETCSSDMFSVDDVQYSKVCGRIRGYQKGGTNAFFVSIPDIDTFYVDGVSLTHGSFPRHHIWTFACALDEDDQNAESKCPCTNTAISSMTTPPQSFVGEDYFCDTSALTGAFDEVFYSDDPLWDGAGCGPQSTCCSFNSPPWFYKQLPQTTTDDIEMRVCRNGARVNEDIAIDIVELYVQ